MSLRVQNLLRHYGGVKALDGVSFDVKPGQCVALIGPNGAGKSTCFACLAGQQLPGAGQVFWHGRDVTALAPAQRQALGMARTFQVAQTFEALTVAQNLQLVLSAGGLSWGDRLAQREREQALALLAQVGLQAQADAVAADLPYGARKRLELALALAGLPPQGERLLLLDEPAAGLAPSERAGMMALVRKVVATGVTVLYTEHNMDAVFGVADRVLVLMQGRLVADGTPEAVARDPRVREGYLGQDFQAPCVAARSDATPQPMPTGSPRFARDDDPCVAARSEATRQSTLIRSPRFARDDDPCVAARSEATRQSTLTRSPRFVRDDDPCVTARGDATPQPVPAGSPCLARDEHPRVTARSDATPQPVHSGSPRFARDEDPCVAARSEATRQSTLTGSPRLARDDDPCVAARGDATPQPVPAGSPRFARDDDPCLTAGSDASPQPMPTGSPRFARDDDPCVTARSEATRQSTLTGSPRLARDEHPRVTARSEATRQSMLTASTGRARDDLRPVLSVEGLDAWWGHAQALFDVQLQVAQGELVVLQGLNGAGKSTLLQALMGIGPRVQGRIVWDGQAIERWPAHRRARAGLGFVAEDRRLFTGLSVQDNLWIAASAQGLGTPAARYQRVLTLFPQLKAMLARPASQMSGGEQQMLALARTLMTGPRLLLLDEPCEGIAPVLVAAMRDALLQLAAEGMTLLVAEQNRILAGHAHRVLQLVGGRLQQAPAQRA